MFKRLGKILLKLWLYSNLLLIALLLVFVFFGDDLAKPWIEKQLQKEAQKQYQAELQLAGLEVDWLSQELTIEGLQLNSIYQQQGNDLYLGQGVLQVDGIASWKQQALRIQSLSLQQLDYIIDHPVSVAGNKIALPSAKSLLSQRLDDFDGQIKKAQADTEKVAGLWQGQLKSIIDEEKIQNYRDQISRWRYAQGRERIQNLARIEASLRGELDALTQIERNLRRNRNMQRQQNRRLVGMPKIQSKRLLDPALVSKQFGEFGSEVIGKELRQPLVQLINFYAQIQVLPKQLQMPLWLGDLQVSGNFGFNGQGSSFELTAKDISLSKEEQFLVVDISGDGIHGGSFESTLGYADKRLSASIDIKQFGVKTLDVGMIEVGEVSSPLTIESAAIDGVVVLDLSKTQIAGELVAIVEPAKFAPLPKDLPDLGQALAQVLADTNAFDVQLQLAGHNRAPRLKVKSSLDGIFSPEFLKQVETQAGRAQTELEKLIQERYGDEIKRVEALGEQFDQLPNTVAQRKTELRDLIQLVNSLQP